MADQNLNTPQYCTDVQYMTKAEMRKYLETNLIDYQWNLTAAYRKQNAVELPLRDINNYSIKLTKTPAIIEKIDKCSALLNELSEKIESLSKDAELFARAKKIGFSGILAVARNLEGDSFPEPFLTAMLTDVYAPSTEEEVPVYGYLNLLREIVEKKCVFAGEDYLAHVLETLEGTDELLSFYREDERKSRYTMTTQAVYERCPANLLEVKMEALFRVVGQERLNALVKSLLLAYFVQYLKPFDRHNELIACALGKAYMSENGMGAASAFLPYEEFLIPNERLSDINASVQTDHDFTYFVCYAIEHLNIEVENLLNELSRILSSKLKEEHYRLTESDLEAFPSSRPAVEKTDETEEIEVEESEMPASPTKEPVEEPETKTKKERAVPTITSEEMASSGVELAIVTPRPSLSDKEVKEVAKYILETHPNIRKPQALFYASHCTIGRYYTIQDYKKAMRCVYETARTSMDNLANEGFYQKLQFKNKFVYSPIKQGEKQ